MSTRCYPLFVKGNPQLRVFLPNFWMKLVKPKREGPANSVKFIVSTEMTIIDIKNYLEKIYNVPVKEVRVRNIAGEYKKDITNTYVIKDDDYKMAYVSLPADHKFEFPNLFPEDKKQDEPVDVKAKQEALQQSKEAKLRNWTRPGIPSWFGA